MPDTDQELACLHVDILSTLFRVELAVGVAEQQAQALFQQALLAENVNRRWVCVLVSVAAGRVRT
jgi:hypothetical protein